jgi:hypothetical protein
MTKARSTVRSFHVDGAARRLSVDNGGWDKWRGNGSMEKAVHESAHRDNGGGGGTRGNDLQGLQMVFSSCARRKKFELDSSSRLVTQQANALH